MTPLHLDSTEVLTITDAKREKVIALIDSVVGDACRNINDWDYDSSCYLARHIWNILRAP
jgi:hypothetical protein